MLLKNKERTFYSDITHYSNSKYFIPYLILLPSYCPHKTSLKNKIERM